MNYDHIVEGIQIWSKYDWYEHGKKSTKPFQNSEKQRRVENTTKILIIHDTEATDQICILDQMKDFYETLFKNKFFF